MKHLLRLPLRACLGCVLLLGHASATNNEPAPPPLSIEELTKPQFLSDASISPDGRHLGVILSNPQNSHYLAFMDLQTGKSEVLKAEDGLDIYSFRWVNDREILFNVSKDRRYAYGLYRAELGQLADHNAINVTDLTRIIGLPRDRPESVIVHIVQSGLRPDADSRLSELDIRHNAKPGKRRALASLVLKNYPTPGGNSIVSTWISHPDGEVGYAITYKNLRDTLYRYDSGTNDWQTVELDLDTYTVVAADPDGHSLWVSHYQPSRGFLLQKYDPVSGAFAEPIWEDPGYDLGTAQLHFSRQTKRLAGLEYYQRRLFSRWFEQPFASAHAALQKRYPETDISLASYDDRERKFLFVLTGATEPARTVLLDLDKQELMTVNSSAPELKSRPLVAVQPISYRTRDGLRLEGYLAVPPQASASHKVPLVVLPHDEWWDRDVPRFNRTVQFLVSRGYAVLQPNYRGSSGYVPAVSKDDRYSFRRRHDDITDAARAISRLDMIDSSRLAIMGQGFGAYLALCGVAYEPGLYRCAIAVDGIYDWESFMIEISRGPQHRRSERLRDHLRNATRTSEKFADFSPINEVSAIAAPLLVVHDTEEYTHGQSAKLKKSLEKHRRPYEVFLSEFDAQGPTAVASWQKFFQQVEVFLKRNL